MTAASDADDDHPDAAGLVDPQRNRRPLPASEQSTTASATRPTARAAPRRNQPRSASASAPQAISATATIASPTTSSLR